MGNKNYRTYTEEFKKQSVALATEIGYSKAGRQLGVPPSSLHGWRKQFESSGAMPMSKKTEGLNYEEEFKKLQKENAELKKINTILKAAAAFFSQDHLK